MLSGVALRARMLRDARSLAVASALAVLTGVTLLIAVAGRDAVGTATTAARLARTAVALALPGALLAAAAPRLSRRARAVGALGGAAVVAAVAIWQIDDGGLALVPAALLLAAAALPRAAQPTFAPVGRLARSDLAVAGGLAALVGLAGRAATLDGVGPGVAGRCSVLASGLVLLAWPLVTIVFVPARLRHPVPIAAAALLVALVVLRAPAGGEAWLTPAVVLTLLGACTPTTDGEAAIVRF